MATAETPAPKSEDRIAKVNLPRKYRHKNLTVEYEPSDDPAERIRGADGLEMPPYKVRVRKDGWATIEYEDGTGGPVDVFWV